jgi:hypothetical protein
MNKLLSRSYKRDRRLGRIFGHDEGQGQIELIISILTIMFTIFWTWEVVLAVYTYNVLSDAAKEGVRYAIVHGSNNAWCSGPQPSGKCPSQTGLTAPTLCDGSAAKGDAAGSDVITTVNCYAKLSLHDISGMTVTPAWTTPASSPNNQAPNEVNVTVKYTYVPFLALPITPTLQTAASGRIVN